MEKITSDWIYRTFVQEARKEGLTWAEGDWSRRIFGAMSAIAKQKGLKPSDSFQGGHFREWLVDHVWAEKAGWDYDGLVLACECELKPSWAHILEDAMKLADVQARHKVLICAPPLRDADPDTEAWTASPIAKFVDYTKRHRWVTPDEEYLAVALTWQRGHPDVIFRGFAWTKNSNLRQLEDAIV